MEAATYYLKEEIMNVIRTYLTSLKLVKYTISEDLQVITGQESVTHLVCLLNNIISYLYLFTCKYYCERAFKVYLAWMHSSTQIKQLLHVSNIKIQWRADQLRQVSMKKGFFTMLVKVLVFDHQNHNVLRYFINVL